MAKERNTWWFQVGVQHEWGFVAISKTEAREAMEFAARMVKAEYGLKLHFMEEQDETG